jgi:hypothetical protein
MAIDLTKLEVYCHTPSCGEPVLGIDGVDRYSKRRMIYSGKGLLSDAVYLCPFCGKKRSFRRNLISDGFHEV